ncbi:MAG: hypothetical protein JWP75_1859 [Frondihabitans sp.]|nr:hypothetical protein [Frondihabitans sp.]
MSEIRFQEISRRGGHPLREQVRAVLAKTISDGVWVGGDQLPTETQLAQQFNVSLAPVRSALQDLADAGLISRQQGVGTFVTDRTVVVPVDLLRSFTTTLTASGFPFSTRVHVKTSTIPPDRVLQQLENADALEAVHLRRVATVEGRRSVVLDSWLPLPRFERLLSDPRIDEPNASLYAYLESEFDVHLRSAQGQLTVGPCGEELLPFLDLPFGAPVVTFEAVGRDEAGTVAEVTRATYNAAAFVFRLND